MPELPDVEVLRRFADRHARHRLIGGVEVLAPGLLTGTTPARLVRNILDRSFGQTARHGKHLFLGVTDGPWVMLHFGMTGELALCPADGSIPPFTCLMWRFGDGGALAYLSKRKLGEICLVDSPQAFVNARRLGPDALDRTLTPRALEEMMSNKARALKSLLLDQHILAGLGNLYADELLFQMGLHPNRPCHRLSRDVFPRWVRTMRRILLLAIAREADPKRFPRTWLRPFRHPRGRCPRCRAFLRMAIVGGRTTYWCPRCQR